MKIFKNKNLLQKMLIALILVIFLSMTFSNSVHAIDLEKLGGKLLDATLSLFVAIGDGVMGIIQDTILGMDESLVNINTDSSWWAKFWVILGTIAISAICITAVILSGGTVLAIGIGIAKVVAISIGTSIITFPITTSIVEGMMPNNFYLPIYEVSPYEIFSNKLVLLNTNFFSTSLEDEKKVYNKNYSFSNLKLDNGNVYIRGFRNW